MEHLSQVRLRAHPRKLMGGSDDFRLHPVGYFAPMLVQKLRCSPREQMRLGTLAGDLVLREHLCPALLRRRDVAPRLAC